MTAAVDGRRMPTKLSETSAVTMILSKIEYAGMISFHRTPGEVFKKQYNGLMTSHTFEIICKQDAKLDAEFHIGIETSCHMKYDANKL